MLYTVVCISSQDFDYFASDETERVNTMQEVEKLAELLSCVRSVCCSCLDLVWSCLIFVPVIMYIYVFS